MSDVSEGPRFEISVNGVVQTTGGMENRGGMSILLTWGARDPEEGAADHAPDDPDWQTPTLHLEAAALDAHTEVHHTWLRLHAFAEGDVIAVRDLGPGRIDPPWAVWPMNGPPPSIPFRDVDRGESPPASHEAWRGARFAVRVNGALRSTIGVGPLGLLGALVDWSAWPERGGEGAPAEDTSGDSSAQVGVDLFGKGRGEPKACHWPSLGPLEIGDVVTFELLGPGPSDPSEPWDHDQASQNEKSPAKDGPSPGSRGIDAGTCLREAREPYM